ncbi:MAG: c-type cytochrome domain-containing protein [Candidatus Thiodiazotropha sp.]
MFKTKPLYLLTTLSATLLLAGCSAGPAPVSYKTDVKPLIDHYCTECHLPGGAGANASGFVTQTYESLMKGTKYGPVIVADDPLSSSFYRLIAGKVDPSIRMPHSKELMKDAEIQTIEHWITQGAQNN